MTTFRQPRNTTRMSRKRALVVDDSRTARAAMRKMLEGYDFIVDTAECAEEALEYLGESHPNVVFMDHMMPGMNGFQALKRIKRNPDTAAIPIMMFTSKEGEVYVSQARALGAVGVINKEVKEPELRHKLAELHLVEEEVAQESELASVSPLFPDVPLDVEVLPAAESIDFARLRQQTRRLLEEHRAELKKDLHDASESAANTVADDFYEMLFGTGHIGPASINDFFRRSSGAAGAWKHAFYASVGVICLLLLLGYFAWPTTETETAVVTAPPPPAETTELEPATLLAGKSDAASRVALAQSIQEKKRFFEAIEWAVNINSRGYDYGEVALNDGMLHTVNGLASRLSSIDFQGVLRLVVHVGNFCLVTNEAGQLLLPAPDLPLAECVVLGLSSEAAIAEGERQSLGFANFLSTSPLINNSGIDVEIVSVGNEQPLQEYPPDSAASTAGAWNEIARRNNRVNISILPAGN